MWQRAISGGGGGGTDIDSINVGVRNSANSALAYQATNDEAAHSKCKIWADFSNVFGQNTSVTTNRVIATVDVDLSTGTVSNYQLVKNDTAHDKSSMKPYVEGISYNTSTHKFTTSASYSTNGPIYSFLFYD